MNKKQEKAKRISEFSKNYVEEILKDRVEKKMKFYKAKKNPYFLFSAFLFIVEEEMSYLQSLDKMLKMLLIVLLKSQIICTKRKSF